MARGMADMLHVMADMVVEQPTEVSEAWSCMMWRDQNKNVANYIVSWYQINQFFISNLNFVLILVDHILRQNETMWLAELIISAIYDQLMKQNFLS